MDLAKSWRKIKCFIEGFFYDVRYGIENIIKWFPVIWKDRNWDFCFIYKVLRHKLYLMEYQIRKYGHHIDNEKDADKIKLCINLLDRIIKDEYHEMAFKSHENKWGEADMIFTDLEDNPEMCSLDIKYPKIKNEKDQEQERKDFKRAMKHEDNLREQDLDMLFKYMRKHIQSWWD